MSGPDNPDSPYNPDKPDNPNNPQVDSDADSSDSSSDSSSESDDRYICAHILYIYNSSYTYIFSNITLGLVGLVELVGFEERYKSCRVID